MGEMVAIGSLDSPIGVLRVAATETGVLRIAFPRGSGDGFQGWIRKALPEARTVTTSALLDEACEELAAYFAGRCREFKVPLDLRGTAFQRSAWRALLEIPYGQTRSYAEVARGLGRPGAARAVGAANAANPTPIIVPCHRVIAADGGLGGFGGGLATKRRLLAFEQAEDPSNRLV